MTNHQLKSTDCHLIVDLQNALEQAHSADERADEGEDPPSSDCTVPTHAEFLGWAEQAYAHCANGPAEMSIRLVSSEEMLDLNTTYRNQAKTTNVLSFTVDLDARLAAELESTLLGDVVICHDVVRLEATDQERTVKDHYAHLVTHGVLHLCGYDHQSDREAQVMESLEQKILAAQGINNPYA